MLLTVSFVVCLVYGIRKIFRRHQVSKASRRFLAPIEQDWEDVGPIEVHLQMFFSRREKHSLAILMRRRISALVPPSCEISDPR